MALAKLKQDLTEARLDASAVPEGAAWMNVLR